MLDDFPATLSRPVAEHLHERRWSPLPLPPRAKSEPPKGYTGYAGPLQHRATWAYAGMDSIDLADELRRKSQGSVWTKGRLRPKRCQEGIVLRTACAIALQSCAATPIVFRSSSDGFMRATCSSHTRWYSRECLNVDWRVADVFTSAQFRCEGSTFS